MTRGQRGSPERDQCDAAERDARDVLDARAAAGVRTVDPRLVDLASFVTSRLRGEPAEVCPHAVPESSPRVVRVSLVGPARRPSLWCQPCRDELDALAEALDLPGPQRCDRCDDTRRARVPVAVVVGSFVVDLELCRWCAEDHGLPGPELDRDLTDSRHDGGPSTPTPITRRTP